jgi:holo-[acyl-carrier protein] synthase
MPFNDSEADNSAPDQTAAIAIGVDLFERKRIIETHARFGERFLRRVFTDRELEQAGGRIERLAGRFAAKEAAAKMLGTGIGATIAWREIEIVRLDGGKPHLVLHGGALAHAATLGLTAFDISISDTGDHVLAVAVGARAGG